MKQNRQLLDIGLVFLALIINLFERFEAERGLRAVVFILISISSQEGLPCSKQKSSQAAFPICTPACPICTLITSL